MTKQIDPIIDELHATRRAIAERFNFDVRKISEDAKQRQMGEGRPAWRPESANKAPQSTSVKKATDVDRPVAS
jgi:hypothetical protein